VDVHLVMLAVNSVVLASVLYGVWLLVILNKWSKTFDERPHRRGQIFHRDSVIAHRPDGSFAVICSSPALVTLFRIELSILLHTPQQRIPVLFNRPDSPQNFSFPWEISIPI